MSIKAAIIGSGVAGLASAIRLAVMGYQVDVFEANGYLGGKLTEIDVEGFRFDAGPSLLTMPELIDELFTLAGKNPRDYITYQRLPIVTKYFYEDGTEIDAFAEVDKLAAEINRKTGEPAEHVLAYLNKSRELYDLTEHIFLKSSLHESDTFMNTKALQTGLQLHKLDLFRTMDKANRKRFNDPRIVQLFDRYATYNGSNPFQAPATLNIIPHLEFNMGAYFPEGGMHSITKALVKLGEELGVKYHLNVKVDAIMFDKKKAWGLGVDGEIYEYDLVVSNMDIVNTYRKLMRALDEPEKTLNQPRSSSALIYYWGVGKQFPQLDLHNIFFSADYQEEFNHLFKLKTIYSDPTVYVNISSKYSPSDAPVGAENWFVMVNAPNNSGQDWKAIRKETEEKVLAKLSRMLGEDIGKWIIADDYLDPLLIESRTSSYQGALYGSSSNNRMAAFLRHANFHSHLSGLYFCGGSVHPGGGIPLSLMSANIVADLVKKHEPLP